MEKNPYCMKILTTICFNDCRTTAAVQPPKANYIREKSLDCIASLCLVCNCGCYSIKSTKKLSRKGKKKKKTQREQAVFNV